MPVPLRKAVFALALAAAAAFVIGRMYPESAYQALQDTAERLRADFRHLAQDRDEGELELRRLRLQARLDAETIEQLKEQTRQLQKENLEQLEKEIFYSKLGARSDEKINVYALEATPDFRPGVRRFSAALVTPPRRRFDGGYYFEAVTKRGDIINRDLVRAPAEGTVPLSVNIYADIEQTVEMDDDLEISRLRLVVVDKDGKFAQEGIWEAGRDELADAVPEIQGEDGG